MTDTDVSTATFGNDDRLPQVPLPTLEDSAARFLEWCAPLLDEEQLAATRAATDELLAPEGPARTLQADLARFAAGDDVASWLDEFWPRRYLGRRDRIALNANFFFLFGDNGSDQPTRAAELTMAALGHKAQLDDESFPPLLARGAPQSMEQSKHLFSTTRIPGAPQDTVRTPYSPEWPGRSAERHIVVLSRGRMYRMDVLGSDGLPHTVDEIAAGMRTVLSAATDRAPVEESVGSLTTKARAEWAATRAALAALDPANAGAIDVVERALFCVDLDDVTPTGEGDTRDQAVCRTMLAGDSGNRWFDKAVSFVVLADGTAGINVEHCLLDGTTILTLVDAMLGEPVSAHAERVGAHGQGEPAVTPVEFVLDDALRADVRAAAEDFDAFLAATATTVLTFDDFGAETAKSLGSSPDAFVQMAYQLAHRRARGLTGATYESIATRQFRGGRTEAMRVVTPEVLAFVEAMQSPGTDAGTRREAFRAAAAAHGARARQCQAGDAPEQHLWELDLIRERRGAGLGVTEPMALFDSPGWAVMRSDYLSTSSAPSTHIRYFGFGSTSEQCIGVAYVLLPDRLHVHLSTPEAVAGQMTSFADELRRAVGELRELLGPE
ncbi:choline/carnitine O-acyltransferase [Pseudonocardia sp. KRD291]|uniref:choline/carnitine O-acyltransferase n=1 Tax=Pseudonocardia sp. KRD291 TaxID=2792007 RepID=UPI001C4A1D79|nr:choline/carnitine O-acyltransferase [Pseudonocardia sp. KRD291]MBW0105142.1 choline/carnitine O-acyltransferase [Pseudonocardia sp. KRD291]